VNLRKEQGVAEFKLREVLRELERWRLRWERLAGTRFDMCEDDVEDVEEYC